MSWKGLRETLGFLGVVLSLVFVGIEIRQNTAATQGQTRQYLAAQNQDWLVLLTTDPEFADLYQRAWIDDDGLVAAEELQRATWIKLVELRRQENVFFQVKAGLVDETALQSYGLQFLRGQLQQPRFREWWFDEGWRERFHPEFVQWVEASLGDGP